MDSSLVNLYAAQADAKERDPIQGGDIGNRATVPMGRGFALYKRFHPGARYVAVTTLDGRIVELTRTQADVFDLARTYIDGESITMRQLADILKVAPSTVWRALVKLTAFGLIAYVTMRGHYGGTFLFARGRNDAFGHLQRAAKERVKRWADATKERFSRLRDSVAPYVLDRGRDSLSDYFLSTTYKGATLKEWTPQELREAGII
jgi:predicted transcriptional regulator